VISAACAGHDGCSTVAPEEIVMRTLIALIVMLSLGAGVAEARHHRSHHKRHHARAKHKKHRASRHATEF
jgi:hypothetical protein